MHQTHIHYQASLVDEDIENSWGEPERAPHRRYMCARSVYMYVCMVHRTTITSLYVLYSSAHFISEAQCSPETAHAHVHSESLLNQYNKGDRVRPREGVEEDT